MPHIGYVVTTLAFALAVYAAVVAVVGSRAIVVYGFSWLSSLWRGQAYIPPSWRHVLFWGGLRGAISLAKPLGGTD